MRKFKASFCVQRLYRARRFGFTACQEWSEKIAAKSTGWGKGPRPAWISLWLSQLACDSSGQASKDRKLAATLSCEFDVCPAVKANPVGQHVERRPSSNYPAALCAVHVAVLASKGKGTVSSSTARTARLGACMSMCLLSRQTESISHRKHDHRICTGRECAS